MTVLYVDVSHHDRNRRGSPLDWAAITAAGLSGVMCARVTYGDPGGWYRPTRYAAEMLAGAKTAGYAARGGYHNLVRGDDTSIGRQVDWLRRELDANAATWAMCDIEAYDELRLAGLVPRWSDVTRFHDRWYALEQRVCAWYLPAWFWRDWLGSAPDLRYLKGPLIQSHYTGGDGTAQQIYTAAGGDTGTGWDDSYGQRLPDIWQYTSVGNVPGASNTTDCNAYRGTVAQLISLLNGDDMQLTDELSNGWTVNNALVTLLARTDYLANRAGLVAKLEAILAEVSDDTTTPTVITPEDQQAIAQRVVAELAADLAD